MILTEGQHLQSSANLQGSTSSLFSLSVNYSALVDAYATLFRFGLPEAIASARFGIVANVATDKKSLFKQTNQNNETKM